MELAPYRQTPPPQDRASRLSHSQHRRHQEIEEFHHYARFSALWLVALAFCLLKPPICPYRAQSAQR